MSNGYRKKFKFKRRFKDCQICYEGSKFTLSCSHIVCHSCIKTQFEIASKTKQMLFNHLFCPFKCKSTWLTIPNINEDIRKKTEDGLETYEIVKQTMTNQANIDGLLTHEVLSSLNNEEEIQSFCMSKYSCYQCERCKKFYAVRKLCGDGMLVDSNEDEMCLCNHCILKENVIEKVSLYRPPRRLYHPTTQSFTPPIQYVDSDDNAFLQRGELEALQAIYPDEIEIINPAPEQCGEMCAVILLKMPPIEGIASSVYDSKRMLLLQQRLKDQLTFEIYFSSGYPLTASPILQLGLGNLGLSEFDVWLKVLIFFFNCDTICNI